MPPEIFEAIDKLGATTVAVVVLVVLLLPMMKRDKKEGHNDLPAALQVQLALIEQRLAAIEKQMAKD
jgi:hypothetical protein